VPAAAHRDEKRMRACELDRAHHVGRTRAARDERRPAIDHPVPHLPGLFVSGRRSGEQRAAKACAEVGNIARGKQNTPAVAHDGGEVGVRAHRIAAQRQRRAARGCEHRRAEGSSFHPSPLCRTRVRRRCAGRASILANRAAAPTSSCR
jgi:hypothetical protein